MALENIDGARGSPSSRSTRSWHAWLWLALGSGTAIFACGGRWDIAILAWLSPILLVRFSRTSSIFVAGAGLLTAMLVQNTAYIVLTAIPLNGMTALLGITVSVAFALPFVLDRTIGSRLPAAARIFLLPVASVAVEFGIGSVLPLGTAIGMRAITQGENLALLQLISITGPYAIAFMIGCVATVANRMIEVPTGPVVQRYGGPLMVALITILMLGQVRLALGTPSPMIPTVKVAAITPDRDARRAANNLLTGASFPPSAKTVARARTPEMRAAYARIGDALLADTKKAARSGAKIVVWSETAAPSTADGKGALLASVSRVARKEGIYIVASVGVPFERNETFLLGSEGGMHWHYRKNHPVPGMEPVPPFENAVPVVSTSYGRLASLICFDGDFPALARVDADILITPSWDWPEVTFAHTMRMVRLRAIENGYALIRPTFDGVTGAFDRYGRILAMQETMSDGSHIMIVDMPISAARTIYNRFGDVFAWLCVAGLSALLVFGLLPKRRLRNDVVAQKLAGGETALEQPVAFVDELERMPFSLGHIRTS